MEYNSYINQEGALILSLWQNNPEASWGDLGVKIAVGKGNSDWDTDGIDAFEETENTLLKEVCRITPYWQGYLDIEMFDLGKILYSADDKDIIRFVAEFDADLLIGADKSGSYIRELAVFVNATNTKDMGVLLLLQRHTAYWWDKEFSLRKEVIIDLRG